MATDLSGRIVGNYRIVEKIGEGGMGSVYRAVDLMLDREVAVKAIRPALAEEPESVKRFHAEAKLAARLVHPTIATIFGFFAEAEQLFLVMELVRGESLAQRLKRRGALPWPEAAQIVATALEGIAVAHRAGIVHRDLKPDNLMVTDDGAVKVMDFGIARALEGTRLTRTGLLVGTLAYMAPEQIRGEEVDHRTDLYSMGIVLYQALTGRPPFEGSSDFAILKAQIDEAPKPPGTLVPGLPLWLERTVMKALAKEPGMRFQTADEMRQVLVAGAVVATVELQQTELLPARAAAAKPIQTPQPSPPPLPPIPPPPPPFAPPTPLPQERTAVPLPPPPAASTFPAVPPVPAAGPPLHTTRSSDYRPVGLKRSRPLLLAAVLVACAVLGGFFAWRFLQPAPRLEEQAASADPQEAVPSEAFLTNQAEPAAPEAKPVTATTAPPASSPAQAPTPVVPSMPAPQPQQPSQPSQPVPRTTVEPSLENREEPASVAPAPSEPKEPADGGPAAEGELTGLGQNMATLSTRLYGAYSEFLEQKEDGGADLTEADEQLQEELAQLEEYAEDFVSAQKPGWRSRLRGRGADPEQLRRRIAQSLAPIRASAERIDRLMATVAPSPDVRRLWQEIKQRARRASALVGA